ncbi:MAG TPA: glycosyltransferase [Pyrinomonadaceae bacterium]|jgi:glycosyltransferase involved in cell wall biosynthesis
MKLNWFSPLPPARTGIAQYTAQILPALSARADVTLWTDQTEWNESLEQHAKVRRFEPERVRWSELNLADATVYHMGNNPFFHYGCWQTSRRHPGIVVLHDTRLHHFFAGVYRERWRDREGYVEQMKRLYGEDGRRTAEAFWTTRGGPEHIAEAYPLTPLALENSLGVLVHTGEAFRKLAGEKRWPTIYAPLPYAAATRLKKRRRSAATSASQTPYRLIVFGYINPNRRLDALLEALASFPERTRFQLDVYGEMWNADYLNERVGALKLEGLVNFRGFVSESELNCALDEADLAVNLRFPTMGESSLTQLQIWEHSLPSLVTTVDWYRELSTEAVAFVRPEHEVQDIQTHLWDFLSDPKRFARMGQKGRRILERRHSPEIYADALLKFAGQTETLHRRAITHRLSERVGAEMGAWIHPRTKNDAFNRVAEKILPLVV